MQKTKEASCTKVSIVVFIYYKSKMEIMQESYKMRIAKIHINLTYYFVAIK